jgi:anti-anti-sigma factor
VFSATTTVTGDRVTLVVTGEVDMSTADAMYQAATRDNCAAATLDLLGVTFFDSAAIHAVVRLTEQFGGRIQVRPSPIVRRVLDIAGLGEQPWLAPAD